MTKLFVTAVIVAHAVAHAAALVPAPRQQDQGQSQSQCRETSVLILGAGVAGITAAAKETLHNATHDDFIILEYHGVIGGRMRQTNFGHRSDGTPYTVELGANWVQGLGGPGGPENPIWTLAKKHKIVNTYSNYSSILTYDETGLVDFANLLNVFEDSFDELAASAGRLVTDELLDQSMRAGFSEVGWVPGTSAAARAVEWWEWDWETAYNPEESSHLYGIAGYNATFNQYSDENNFVHDRRGFSQLLKAQASTFLKPDDARLVLNQVVTRVEHSDTGVIAHTRSGACYRGAYALSTFSLGVLQDAVQPKASTSPKRGPVEFSPALPAWKTRAVQNFAMGTYTKIFYQFTFGANQTQFWPDDTQYFLYADPTRRGYYTVWQSLSLPGFLPNSGVIFATLVGPESARVEAQTDEQTKAEGLAVLRLMFGRDKVPEPTAFLYPRWGRDEWAFGSYSNWPTGVTLRQHQNLRANVGRLWFAGEATSTEYFGFLHGAYFEGRSAGAGIAKCLRGHAECGEKHYVHLGGNQGAFRAFNGWTNVSFATFGLDG